MCCSSNLSTGRNQNNLPHLFTADKRKARQGDAACKRVQLSSCSQPNIFSYQFCCPRAAHQRMQKKSRRDCNLCSKKSNQEIERKRAIEETEKWRERESSFLAKTTECQFFLFPTLRLSQRLIRSLIKLNFTDSTKEYQTVHKKGNTRSNGVQPGHQPFSLPLV